MQAIDKANQVYTPGNISTSLEALHIVRQGYPDKKGWLLVERWDLLCTGVKIAIVRQSGVLENKSIIGII